MPLITTPLPLLEPGYVGADGTVSARGRTLEQCRGASKVIDVLTKYHVTRTFERCAVEYMLEYANSYRGVWLAERADR